MLVSLPQYCIHNVEGAASQIRFDSSSQVVTLIEEAAVAPNENLANPVLLINTAGLKLKF